jgi:hypothetical protein
VLAGCDPSTRGLSTPVAAFSPHLLLNRTGPPNSKGGHPASLAPGESEQKGIESWVCFPAPCLFCVPLGKQLDLPGHHLLSPGSASWVVSQSSEEAGPPYTQLS